MDKPLLIYVAGPYRAKTTWGIEQNVHAARTMGVRLAQAGAYPVIPHSNTAHFDGEAKDELWLAGTLALMERCDGVVLLTRWRDSAGARAEADRAATLGMPIWDESVWNESLAGWLEVVACVREDTRDVR